MIYTEVRPTDPVSELEPRGLVKALPGLRPADVLSHASGLTSRKAALDVGIANPGATGAGSDCCDTMRKKKHVKM